MTVTKKVQAADEILAGLQDSVRHYSGDAKGGRTFVIEPSAIDVQSIRNRFGLSRSEFAIRFGIPVRTLQNWEQGERVPEGPARAYLAVIEHDPVAVMQALEKSRAGQSRTTLGVRREA
jgi:putative transcriptional regulator